MKLYSALLLLLSGVEALAQTPAQPTTYALIVGISQYKEVAPLQFADRDATAFAGFLSTQHVPEANIRLFLNQDATRLNIVDELFALSQALKPHDRFYFYFGGHGDLEAKIGAENALLLLYNSFKTGYFQGNEYLQLSELKTWFDALTQKQVEVIFIADACHSGSLIGGQEGINKTQQALQARWVGITKMLSCQSDEYSLEGKQWGGGRGLFSYHLVNGLTGRADANKDQQVSLSELSKYLTKNVLEQSNPNVQTPVIVGRETQFLSTVSAEGLAELADEEKRNFPIITEVNLKGDGERANAELVSKLDTSLVNTYKQFTKALKEKRASVYDDSTDNALIYYKQLTARKLPDNLVQLMKRNLGAGLMERELVIMKNVREKGAGGIASDEKVLLPAIANLQEAMKLFGTTHYFHKYLQARVIVLESQLPPRVYPVFANVNTVDKNLENQKEFTRKTALHTKELLLKGYALEPNMISTYALLASSYNANNQPDSAMYYQEKVVELLPNQAVVYLNLAFSYESVPYTDAQHKPAPHPKAIANYEKAIALDSTFNQAYNKLGDLCMGLKINKYGVRDMEYDKTNRNYPRAIQCFEKIVERDELKEEKLIVGNLVKIPRQIDGYNASFGNFVALTHTWKTLYFLHKANGNAAKADFYLNRMIQKAEQGETALSYLFVATKMFQVFEWDEDDADLNVAITLQVKGLQTASDEIIAATIDDKALLALKYRERLKSIGATYRALKNYSEAENYFKQAISYKIPESPILKNLKLAGSRGFSYKDRAIAVPNPHCVQRHSNGDYSYQLDAYCEMFYLKLEQNKPDEAYEWLDKGFQQSLVENGNDLSGEPFEEEILSSYKNIDRERFKTLKAKYFPPTADKK